MTTLDHFMRTRVTLAACLAAVFCALVAPTAAFGDAYDKVFADYQKDGRIDPCKHSEKELRTAKGQIPSDIEQYAPDFPAALDDALEERARGGCEKSGTADSGDAGAAAPTDGGGGTPSATGGAAPANTTPAPNAPGVAPAPPGTASPAQSADDGAIAQAASKSADKGGDAPAPLLVLAVVGGLLLLGAVLWALARFFAFEPAWWVRWRHALSEAGWHVGGAWENFSDWLRRGRAAG